MRPLLALTLALAISQSHMQQLLETAFYPALLLVFIVASLGIPIPEDIPLIAAGVILKTNPHVASWPGALLVSMIGIMSGDMILYNLGRKWGREVFAHRSVAWLITPRRLEIMTERFHRYGVWACFFGRFMVGVRAIMCLTAGVTRFQFWKFFLADFCGALLSVPFFIGLGYMFAHMLDSLKSYIAEVQTIVGAAIGLIIAGVIWYEFRRLRKMREADAAAERASSAPPDPAVPATEGTPQAGPQKPTGRSFEPVAKSVARAK
jgi:membrane protein DedA with SNARE-associated domain